MLLPPATNPYQPKRSLHIEPRVNEQIRADEVFLIGPHGEVFGNVSIDQAHFLAYDADMDLIEINPNRQPPIVKMSDFSKYRYDLKKKQRESKTKTKGPELKEIRLTRKIDTHDLDTKSRRAIDWIKDGNKVRVYLQLMGREYIFADQAKTLLNRFCDTIGGVFEQEPTLFGNRIIAIIRKK